jgi:hypothetical protein
MPMALISIIDTRSNPYFMYQALLNFFREFSVPIHSHLHRTVIDLHRNFIAVSVRISK